jgi:hypothetical protein
VCGRKERKDTDKKSLVTCWAQIASLTSETETEQDKVTIKQKQLTLIIVILVRDDGITSLVVIIITIV